MRRLVHYLVLRLRTRGRSVLVYRMLSGALVPSERRSADRYTR
jgi:hypothetical protein